MENIITFISQPWAWYVAGPMITLVMFLLVYFGKSFGVSSNLRTMCAIGGAGRYADFFQFDWKTQIWNLIFVLGATIGGFIAFQYLGANQGVQVSENVITELKAYGFDAGNEYTPVKLFEDLGWKEILFLVVGGFLVGFGTRYAGGCTSGHAISGLSDLQLPSLIAVIGFFVGGLTMTYFILPFIL
ncbi:MAG: YeeE/YedE family protein [Cytophagales bacterium]|nr:YeeE/YedE family protein [Cytophagales bacterium]